MAYPKGEVVKPAVLTPEVQKVIVALIAEGNYLVTACKGAGISKDTFNYWRRLHEAGEEVAKPYADFFTAIEKANAKAESDALSTIRKGSFGWQGSAWFLERRFSKRWGKKVEVVDPRNVKAMTDAELEAAAEGKGGG